jgi:RNA 2',3'-cyclic 3'-phosphodiesterase
MRIFVALETPNSVRDRIAQFIEDVRELAANAGWVRPESLHVTLKFIGEKSPAEVEKIKHMLAGISGQQRFDVAVRGCGFFPSAKSARVFWVGIEENPRLKNLANAVDEAVCKAGIPREEHEFNPHLTLARAGSGAPQRLRSDRKKRVFEKLQERLAKMDNFEFGTMTASEFILFESKLSPSGAHYATLARFPLAQS